MTLRGTPFLGWAVAGLLFVQCGCEKGDKGAGDDIADRNAVAAQFSVTANGQGVPGSAAYVPGGGATVLPIYFNTAAGAWFWGCLVDDPSDWIPSGNIAHGAAGVQLVLITVFDSQPTDWTYTNGSHFHHATCHAELREAASGRLVAQENFAGDNHVNTKGSDKDTITPVLAAWILRFL